MKAYFHESEISERFIVLANRVSAVDVISQIQFVDSLSPQHVIHSFVSNDVIAG